MPTVTPLPKKEDLPKEKVADKQSSRLINRITFFGDSAIPEGDPIYQSVWNAAKTLAENNYTIIDGGGPGIMKAATDGAESVDGKTIAVYWQPKLASFFEGKNLANVTDESSTSSNYVMRTFGLIEKGDAYVVCKGGTGTISEFGLVWCLAKLYYGCHKPVILYGDFWDKLIEAFQETMYIDETELGVLYQATTPEQVLQILNEHEAKIQHCALKKFDGDEIAFVLSGAARNIANEYDKVAGSYHSEHAGKLVAQDQLDEFMSLVNPPAKVLDIGTGPGFDAKYLSEKYAVTGVEPSEKFYNIAQFECPNVTLINGDITKLDLEKGKYKGVWARDSIHHIKAEHLDNVFQKIADSLVDDGIFYVIVREGEGEINEKEGKKYSEDPVERFYHLFTTQELIERAEKAGMKLVKMDRNQRSHEWLVGVFKKA